MDKSNLAEIRKALRKDEPPVDWIYSFYVTPENELSWQSFRKFLSFDEDEMFRHKEILTKSLMGSFGRELFPAPLASQAEKLFALRTLDEPGEEILEEFAGEVVTAYPHTDPYYACLARITYDVPAMSTDHRRLEDGDVVFQSLLFSISTAALSKPALGYSEESGVAELDRRWTIGVPVEGFLYPSFNERIGDMNEVLYRAKKEISGDLFGTFFDSTIPANAKVQKDAFNTLMDSLNISMEEATGIQEDLSHLEAENVTVLEKEDAKKLAERCGIDTEEFDESYDDIIGDVPLSVSALKDPAVVVATDSATIKIPADKAGLVKTRVIDGVNYIMIPIDGAVLVNGIPTSNHLSDDNYAPNEKLDGDDVLDEA
ncbi:MAG: DUF4317 family protein, partial [Lachnospiraceae bacterium]|nr:DUF4317 family protein [Lachnospiraceae bacterium]